MRTEDLTNETDGLFKKGFGELPEEAPGAEQWQQMKGRMADEGLISGKSRRPGLVILFSLLIVGSLSTALYLLNIKHPLRTIGSGIGGGATTTSTTTSTATDAKMASPRTSSTENEKTEKTITKNNVQENNSAVTATQPAQTIASESQAASVVAEKKVKGVRNNYQKQAIADNAIASTLHRSQPKIASSDLSTETTPSVAENKVEKASDSNDETKQASNNGVGEKNNSSPVLDNHSDQPTAVPSVETESKKSTVNADGNQEEQATVKKDSPIVNPQPSAVASADTSDYKKQAPAKSRFHIGGYFSFDFTNYLVKKNNSVLQSDADYVSQSNAINGAQSSTQFTVGLTGGYMICDRVEVEMGMFYSQKKKVDDNLVTPVNTQNSNGEAYSNFIYNYNAKYLEVNGKVKYYIPSGEASRKFYIGLGAVASFNFPGKSGDLGYFSRTSYNNSTWVQYDKVILEPSSASVSALVAAGFETKICDKWGLFIEPSYKYALNPVIKHPTFDYIPVNHFWRTISLGFGVRYGF
jgi:hypothetical protein